MRYFGGKSRIAKEISFIINDYLKDMEDPYFISPFVGAGNIEQYIHCNKLLNDKHPYLMEMYKDLLNGRNFPTEISEKQYQEIKNDKDKDKGLSGFVGFGCSFAGKWFGGYARDNVGNRNFAQAAVNGLNKKIKNGLLENAILSCKDYTELEINKRAVIYCDPPYQNRTKYCTSLLGNIDYEEFWNKMREWGDR